MLDKPKDTLKRYICILLLISFSLRPAYYVGYVAYFQFNIDYIIETYCVNTDKPELACNGKCHLTKQLNPTTETQDDAILLLSESFFPVFISPLSKLKLPFNYTYTSKHLQAVYVNLYSFTYSDTSFKPPCLVG